MNTSMYPARVCSASLRAAQYSDRRVCLLTLSDIPGDPRVRRQGDALHAAGWKVIGVGLPGATDAKLQWQVMTEEKISEGDAIVAPSFRRRARERLERWSRRDGVLPGGVWLVKHAWKQCCRAVMLYAAIRARIQPSFALRYYWSPWSWPDVKDLYRVARRLKADIWLANDWIMLPLAARLARENGGVYAYDSHELAAAEATERLQWRVIDRPMVKAIESLFIHDAVAVSVVSNGIAERLQLLYQLPTRPSVIRNVPSLREVNFRPVGREIKVLHHGGLVPGRGLEAAIDSVVYWRPEYSLTIRGVGKSSYISSLHERVLAGGLTGRVNFAPAVAMVDLISEAQAFDVGLHALPRLSVNNTFALPNKFFEYIMAGLALCITDLPEMRSLIDAYKLGVTFPDVTPQAIAGAINSLTPERINEFRRNALRAARELNWEQESIKMIELYDRPVPTV